MTRQQIGAAPTARTTYLLGLSLLVVAFGIALFARSFVQLPTRWTFLGWAAALTVCALGALRAAEWARVSGGVLALAFAAAGVALPQIVPNVHVTGVDAVFPVLALAAGVHALLPKTGRALACARATRTIPAATRT